MASPPAIPEALASRYRPIRVLGRGGMATVVAARDRLRDEVVALKLLRPRRRAGGARLREEFALLASIDHPGIVKVRELGLADPRAHQFYVATELVEGVTLDVWLDTSPAPPAVLAVLADILSTLAWLHTHGILHGDLKPSNVLLVPDQPTPRPVLIDFGLAQRRERARLLGGTQRYLAPELRLDRGDRPSPLTDLYALGCCFSDWIACLGDEISRGARASALVGLVEWMCRPDPDDRPERAVIALANAAEALGRRARVPPLGGRGFDRLWSGVAEGLARRVLEEDGPHLVVVGADEDAFPFLASLKAALELERRSTLLLPEGGGADRPMVVWQRLLRSLGSEPGPDWVGTGTLRGRAGLEAVALRVRAALDRLPSLPCLLVGGPARWPDPDLFILARLVELGVPMPFVVARGPQARPLASGWSVAERLMTRTDVPQPSPTAIAAYIDGYDIAGEVPEAVRRTLESRAGGGATALGTQLEVWARHGVLEVGEGHRWRWSPEGDPSEADAPDLDALWDRLFHQLPEGCRAVIGHLWWLGGQAPRRWLVALHGGEAESLAEHIEQLSEAGWIETPTRDTLALRSGHRDRIERARLPVATGVPEALRRRYVQILGDAPDTHPLAGSARLAEHLGALGRHSEAAATWERLGEALEAAFDTHGAGRAFLAAARAHWERSGTTPVTGDFSSQWVSLLERAARHLEAAAAGEGLEAALDLCRDAQAQTTRSETSLRLALVELRAAVHRAHADRSLAIAERADALRRELVSRGDADESWLDEAGFEIDLAIGSAHVQKGEPLAAVPWLERAADSAEQHGDLLALGRVANNLGNVWYQQAEWGRAAEAYRRAGRAKRDANDLRGLRIASSNRALTLRQAGRLVEALEQASDARVLASRIGDRRGEAAGFLLTALLWLDLGSPEAAERSLEAYRQVPVVSDMVRLDGLLVEVRCHLAQRAWSLAEERALRVLETAEHHGVSAVSREARALAYVAWASADRGAGVGVDSAVSPRALREAVTTAQREGQLGELALLRSALAHALALAGDWGRARPLVSDLLDGPTQTIEASPPGTEWGLGLLAMAARLMGLADVVERLRAYAARLLATRLAVWPAIVSKQREVLESDSARAVSPPAPGVAARALGLTELLPHLKAPTAPPPTPPGQEHAAMSSYEPIVNPADALLTRAVTRVDPGAATDPRAWARAVASTVEAERALLVAFEDGAARPCAASDEVPAGPVDPVARWGDVLARLHSGGPPFLARGAGGRAEALGLALVHSAGAPPVGALLVEWGEDGPKGSDEDLARRFERLAALLAVVVDRFQLALSRAGLRKALRDAKERERDLMRAHADEVSALREALHHSQTESELRFAYDRIVYRGPVMKRVLRTLDKVTETDVPVLLVGPSGAGKELLARALHHNGPRRSRPFVAENCGAIPAELFESTFFGHVRGAFTGAERGRSGLLRSADGGTLFLDEVGELRPDHQVKLLRVLQERRFRPVGSERTVDVDFRLVAATHRNLREAVASGSFREDLFYRLAVVTVDVPPLCRRPEDVLPLAQHFLGRHAERLGRELRLSPEAVDALQRYAWPGNVRELDNEILRASVLASGETIEPRHFSEPLRDAITKSGSESRGRSSARPEGGPWTWDGETPLRTLVDELERRVIRQALAKVEGRKSHAAKRLGLSRPGLDSKLKRLRIAVPRRGRGQTGGG